MQNGLDRLMHRIWVRKIPFFLIFFVVVLATYGLLSIIDFVPEPVDETNQQEAEEPAQAATAVTQAEEPEPIEIDPLPTKIIFDSLDKEVNVLNPRSREIADLDAALLEGAVRHPDSADMSVDDGNIFILAHSSYLPNVFNKNFQAFNGIQDLTWGDTIRLRSGNMEYVYFVEEVYKARASDVTVPTATDKAMLTLATCNSFGSKDDRFIVEAKLVEEKPL